MKWLIVAIIVIITFFLLNISKKSNISESTSPIPLLPTLPNTPVTKSLSARVSEKFFNNNPHALVDLVSNYIETWCEKLSTRYSTHTVHPSPELVAAIAMVESTYGINTDDFNPLTTATGVMQITKDTLDTINNIIRAKYSEYLNYANHTYETISSDIDSNIMHACILLDYIMYRIQNINPYLPSHIIEWCAPYVYHYGLSKAEKIAVMSKPEIYQELIDDPYTAKVMSYRNKLIS